MTSSRNSGLIINAITGRIPSKIQALATTWARSKPDQSSREVLAHLMKGLFDSFLPERRNELRGANVRGALQGDIPAAAPPNQGAVEQLKNSFEVALYCTARDEGKAGYACRSNDFRDREKLIFEAGHQDGRGRYSVVRNVIRATEHSRGGRADIRCSDAVNQITTIDANL